MNKYEQNKQRNDLYPFVSDQKEWLKENYFNTSYWETNLTIEQVENLHPRDRYTFFELIQFRYHHKQTIKKQTNRLKQVKRQIRDFELSIINEDPKFKDYYPMTKEQYLQLRELKESWDNKKSTTPINKNKELEKEYTSSVSESNKNNENSGKKNNMNNVNETEEQLSKIETTKVEEISLRDMYREKGLPEWKEDMLNDFMEYNDNLDVGDETTKKVIELVMTDKLDHIPSHSDFYKSDGYSDEDLRKQEEDEDSDVLIPMYDTYLEYHIKDMT